MIFALLIAAFPNPNTGNQNGVGIPPGAVVVTNFGDCKATTNSGVDCLAGFNAAIAAMGNTSSSPPAGDLYVPKPATAGAYYYLSGPLHITRQLHLIGAGGSVLNQYGSAVKLLWPANTNGIVIDYADGVSKNGAGAIISNLALVSSNSGFHTDASAVVMNAAATVENCGIYGWAQDGIHIDASTPASNANQWRVFNSFVQSNARDGIYVNGTDANAGVCGWTVFDSNLGTGIFDTSSLGNTYVGNEISGNTTGSVSLGQVADVNASVADGNYVESGQSGVFVGLNSIWTSGANGSGFDTTSTGRICSGTNCSRTNFENIGGGNIVEMTPTTSVAMRFETATNTNDYTLAFSVGGGLSSVWGFRSQNLDTQNALVMTTANSTRPNIPVVGTVSADNGVVGLRNGLYYGAGGQRIYSSSDTPGANGYFGDLSIRDYQNASTNDGVLGYVNVKINGGQSWADAFNYLQPTYAKTSTYQLLTRDSKHTFSNFGTSSEVEMDLVAYGDDGIANYGWWADFIVEDSHGMKIKATDRSDIIYLGSSVTATNGYLESTTVGSTCRLKFVRFNDPGVNTIGVFYAMSSTGTWTVN